MKKIIVIVFIGMSIIANVNADGKREFNYNCFKAGKLNMLGNFSETFDDEKVILSLSQITSSSYLADINGKTITIPSSYSIDKNSLKLNGKKMQMLEVFKKYKLDRTLVYIENIIYEGTSISNSGRIKTVDEGTFSNNVLFWDCTRID